MEERDVNEFGGFSAAFSAIRFAQRDDAWQVFGWPKYPKYGLLFNLFRPAWKVALEDRVFKELLVVSVALDTPAAATVSPAVRMLAENEPLTNCLGYSSSREAYNDLARCTRRYTEAPPEKWGQLFLEQIEVEKVVERDKRTAANLMAGSARFQEIAQSPLFASAT
jgi:hypothetical protein